MSENPARPTWYHRKHGLIDQVTTPAGEAAERALRRSALCGRFWRGEPLTEDERADLEAMRAEHEAGDFRSDPRSAIGGTEERLGYLAFVRPDLLRRLDNLARELGAAAFQTGDELVGWHTIERYAAGAYEAGVEERYPPDSLQRSAENNARAAATPEGERGLAALLTPDDGPEGWSTVPPGNLEFPRTHPLQGQLLSHLRARSGQNGKR